DMEALSGTVPDRAEAALRAGCDIARNCWAKMDDLAGLCSRLGTMSAATAARHARALDAIRAPRPTADQAELAAKRDALLALLETAELRA
ncbi:MAG: beta-hexosaminidase, partial [Novosphingobium sp.]